MESTTIYEKILHENDLKDYQIRMVVNIFRDVEYLHLRKYFLSFDEGYVATREGVSFPLSIPIVKELLSGLLELLSKAEGTEEIDAYLASKKIDLISSNE
jgi:hypothetical protein